MCIITINIDTYSLITEKKFIIALFILAFIIDNYALFVSNKLMKTYLQC